VLVDCPDLLLHFDVIDSVYETGRRSRRALEQEEGGIASGGRGAFGGVEARDGGGRRGGGRASGG
jgi:hypothetical protein